MGQRIVLYTTNVNKGLCKMGSDFCATNERIFDTDLELTVDGNDVVNLGFQKEYDCLLFNVKPDSVRWTL